MRKSLSSKIISFFISAVFFLIVFTIAVFIVFYYASKILYVLIKTDFNIDAMLIVLFVFFSPSLWMAGKYIASLIVPIFDKIIGIVTSTNFSKDEIKSAYNHFMKTHQHEFEEIIVRGRNTYDKYPEIFPDKSGFALRRLINRIRDYNETIAYNFLKGIGGLKRIYTIVGLIDYLRKGE